MSRIKNCREFVQTREQIYEAADEIIDLMGAHALIDMLLEWADNAYHNEIFRSLEDERAIARLTVGRLP